MSSFNRFSGLAPIAYLFFFMLNGRLPIFAIFKTFSINFLIIFRLWAASFSNVWLPSLSVPTWHRL